VQDKEGDDQGHDGYAVARKIEILLVAFHHQRKVPPHRLDDQGAKHDQERHGKRGEGGDQRVANRFQPQPVPTPRLDHRIGAVERDTQCFDAVRGEIHREHRADGEDVAAGGGQHVVDFPGQRIGDLLRPDLQQQAGCLVGKLLRSEEAGQRRQHDQERKQRHQGRQRDVARNRPAVIGEERVERVHDNEVDVAKLPHISDSRFTLGRRTKGSLHHLILMS